MYSRMHLHIPRVPWLIHVCHDSFICAMTHSCVPWLIHICYVPRNIHMWLCTHQSQHSQCHTQPERKICTHAYTYAFTHTSCTMTHSYVPWLIHMCHDPFIYVMTHSYVPWLIHMCHDSFICAMTHSYVPWLIHMCHDSFIYAMCRDTFIRDHAHISHSTARKYTSLLQNIVSFNRALLH